MSEVIKDPSTPNGNKLSVTLSLLVMVLAIAAAFLKPIAGDVEALSQDLKDHSFLHGHPGVLADLKEMGEKFVGFQNTLESLSERIDAQNTNYNRRILWLEEQAIQRLEADAANHAMLKTRLGYLEERIKTLESRGP